MRESPLAKAPSFLNLQTIPVMNQAKYEADMRKKLMILHSEPNSGLIQLVARMAIPTKLGARNEMKPQRNQMTKRLCMSTSSTSCVAPFSDSNSFYFPFKSIPYQASLSGLLNAYMPNIVTLATKAMQKRRAHEF